MGWMVALCCLQLALDLCLGLLWVYFLEEIVSVLDLALDDQYYRESWVSAFQRSQSVLVGNQSAGEGSQLEIVYCQDLANSTKVLLLKDYHSLDLAIACCQDLANFPKV